MIYRACSAEFTDIARRVLRNPPSIINCEEFEKTATLAAQTFPADIRRGLYDFKSKGNQGGYCLIRNLPCCSEDYLPHFWTQCVTTLLGNVQPIIPLTGLMASKPSLNLFYPRFTTLFQDAHGKELKLSLSSVQNIQLPLTLEDILREPDFETGIFEEGKKGPTTSVIHGTKTDPFILFNPVLMRGTTEAAQRAISLLQTLSTAKKEEISLKAQDLIIIDNYRTLQQRNFSLRTFGYDARYHRLFHAPDLHNFSLT